MRSLAYCNAWLCAVAARAERLERHGDSGKAREKLTIRGHQRKIQRARKRNELAVVRRSAAQSGPFEDMVTIDMILSARHEVVGRALHTLREDIAHVVAAVLAVGDQQGLISREMLVIDRVKLPINASKQRSGTRAECERQAAKREAAAAAMVERHRATDAQPVEPDVAAKTVQRIARLGRDAVQLRVWLATHPNDRAGAKGAVAPESSHRE